MKNGEKKDLVPPCPAAKFASIIQEIFEAISR